MSVTGGSPVDFEHKMHFLLTVYGSLNEFLFPRNVASVRDVFSVG